MAGKFAILINDPTARQTTIISIAFAIIVYFTIDAYGVSAQGLEDILAQYILVSTVFLALLVSAGLVVWLPSEEKSSIASKSPMKDYFLVSMFFSMLALLTGLFGFILSNLSSIIPNIFRIIEIMLMLSSFLILDSFYLMLGLFVKMFSKSSS